MNGGWIGVDLDGTLAYYDGWQGANHVGEPILEMQARVLKWIAEGQRVRIFTARVSHDGSPKRVKDALEALHAIQAWSEKHLGVALPVTCTKDYRMTELYDDRAVQVEMNTGRIIGKSTRGTS